MVENLSVTRANSADQTFKIYFNNSLNVEKQANSLYVSSLANDYSNNFKYLEEYLRKNPNSSFAIDTKKGVAVSTTEQLLYAVENNKKPLFYSNSETAETVYLNAKKVLSAIVSDNMSDLEKSTKIFDWLSSSFNLNLYANKTLNGYDYVDANISVYGIRQDFYLEGIFLNLTNSNIGGFDGEFYLGNKNATSQSLAKAYSLLCGIEGITTISVHGTYENNETTYNHSWNKIYLSTTSNNNDKNWYNVDIVSSTANINYLNVNNSTKVTTHTYFLVTDSFMQNLLNTTENSNIISLNYAAKILATTNYNYYSNSNFALTQKQIKDIADISYSVQYSGFEYVKEYSTETSYQKYANSGFGNLQAYILNVLMYAKYNSLKSFEFSFNWVDNGNEAYISADTLTYINSIAISANNNYLFSISASSAKSILDSANERTIVIITYA